MSQLLLLLLKSTVDLARFSFGKKFLLSYGVEGVVGGLGYGQCDSSQEEWVPSVSHYNTAISTWPHCGCWQLFCKNTFFFYDFLVEYEG